MEPRIAPLALDAVNTADVRGRKVRIRPMRPDEAAVVYSWVTDPEVQPFWGGSDHHKDLDDFITHWEAHYLDGSQLNRGRCFTIEADGRPIGMINYNRVDTASRSTDIDILVGESGYRDRGYGTDALHAFLGFLFDTVHLHRVWLGTYDYNARARRVYEKLGLVQEGVMRQADWVDGRWVDSVIYGILEHEFRRA
jgi:ribosomal-protein-alanine N-acetyltransferase